MRVNIPARSDEDDTAHTLTFGTDLPLTFANALRGLLEKPRPLFVEVWLDAVGSRTAEDVVGPLQFSAQKIVSHADLLALAEGEPDKLNEDDYLVVFPCDENGERVPHSQPTFIPTWQIVRLHVM